MNNDIYNNSKYVLISEAKEAKRTTSKSDKPYIRQCINDQLDQQIRQMAWHEMKETISPKQLTLYTVWLESLACSLHP